MTVLWIALGVLAFLLLAFLIIGYVLSRVVTHPQLSTYEECLARETDECGMDRARYEGYIKHEFTLTSPHGYGLYCMYVDARPDSAGRFPDGRKRVAVFSHGFGYTMLGGMKYADIFYDLGFSLVFCDQRGHGRSGKAVCTMGYYELDDLKTVVDWAFEHYGQDSVLGVHGESMGAATVMMYAHTEPRLAFAVEDCGYSDLTRELAHNAKVIYHIPRFPAIPFASMFARLSGGVPFRRVMPAREVARCREELPMLFVHGEADGFVPFNMVYDNYNAKRGVRRLETYPGAKHARSYTSDPVRYRAMIKSFLEENGII